MSTQSGDFVTGDGRVVNIKDIADIYKNVVNVSTPVSGRIQRLADNQYSLTCRFSTTDCDMLESISTSKSYSLTTVTRGNKSEKCIESVRCITDPYTLSEVATATSDNGRFLARLKENTKSSGVDQTSDKKQLLEIWDRSKLVKTIEISEVEFHGQINTDPQFRSFHWCRSGDQNKLLYVCKKKRPKYQSFFKQAYVKTDDADSANASQSKAINLGQDNVREEDWGECLKGIEHTILAILDVGNDCKISTVDMCGFSLADSQWIDDCGMKTISVAYPEEPRKLGLIYCNNRPSRLVVHDWSQSPPVEVLNLNSDTHCFHTPRVSHSGKELVYLANPIYGPHKHSVRMHHYELDTKVDRELVDMTTRDVDLFVDGLVHNCFSADDKHIIFVNRDHLHHFLCLYNLDTYTTTKIKFPTTGLILLDFYDDIILAIGSEVDATPTLFVSVVNTIDSGELVAWHQIEDCIHLDEIDYESYKIPTADKSSFVSALLVSPRVDLLPKNFSNQSIQDEESKPVTGLIDLPTVVIVHGGPHAAFALHYIPAVVFYARLGLRSMLINYRGSLGVSEEYVRSLCGKVGQLDVEDCLHAIRFFVSGKKINPKKLIIQGGSHGGFLSCHLSCQEEFKFTSAIIRNPVVDISSLHATSDIPDWAYTEALGHDKYDFAWVPGTQELTQMFESSPISKFRQANVPTLMLLGSRDYRVKMFQGERWIELLKARGIKTLCKVYQDKHDLAKVDVASDSTITAIIWILSNLQS